MPPLLPPPPLEGDNTEMPSLSVELTRCTVLDGDFGASVDLGEAVTVEPYRTRL